MLQTVKTTLSRTKVYFKELNCIKRQNLVESFKSGRGYPTLESQIKLQLRREWNQLFLELRFLFFSPILIRSNIKMSLCRKYWVALLMPAKKMSSHYLIYKFKMISLGPSLLVYCNYWYYSPFLYWSPLLQLC